MQVSKKMFCWGCESVVFWLVCYNWLSWLVLFVRGPKSDKMSSGIFDFAVIRASSDLIADGVSTVDGLINHLKKKYVLEEEKKIKSGALGWVFFVKCENCLLIWFKKKMFPCLFVGEGFSFLLGEMLLLVTTVRVCGL